MNTQHSFQYRTAVRPSDVEEVGALVKATDFFSEEEIEIAKELVTERLTKGVASGYKFLIAESKGAIAGYTCYGEIPGTRGSYDLYWIVVHPEYQRQGLGRLLIEKTEAEVRKEQGRQIYADTSGRPQYVPTHAFYERAGFLKVAELRDFYSPGDDKLIFKRSL